MFPVRLLDELRSSAEPTLIVRPEPEREPQSVALVSGSFDPLTVAHAALAEAALEAADLVALVYSVRTLPKEGDALRPPLLEEADRLTVMDAYRRGRPGLAVGVSSHGLLAHQVEAARNRFPGAAIQLVVGSDKLLQLLDPRWYRDRDATLRSLFEQATLRYAVRSGDELAVARSLAAPENAAWRDRMRRITLSGDVATVSSRRFRELLESGADPMPLAPPGIHPVLRRLLPSVTH